MAKHVMLRLEKCFKQRQLLQVHVVAQRVCQKQTIHGSLLVSHTEFTFTDKKKHTRTQHITQSIHLPRFNHTLMGYTGYPNIQAIMVLQVSEQKRVKMVA
jgi:alpha-D-ribose 1-methylphosphonate 5-triphosphate synthase subunit PhnH